MDPFGGHKASVVIPHHQAPAEVAARYGVHPRLGRQAQGSLRDRGRDCHGAPIATPQDLPSALAPEVANLIVRIRKGLADAGAKVNAEAACVLLPCLRWAEVGCDGPDCGHQASGAVPVRRRTPCR